jgi:hypothetical protein
MGASDLFPYLQMVRCARCGRVDTPMRPVCAGCLSSDLQPVSVPARGTVVSYTTIRRAPTQFRDRQPYDIVVVDLDAGPRVTGRLAADSPPASIGARVHAVHVDHADTVFTISEQP